MISGLLQKHFKWKIERAIAFVADRTDDEVIEDVLSWHTRPEAQIVARPLLQSITPVLKREKYTKILKAWVVRWNTALFMTKVSDFELETTCEVNPFYPLNAFSMPYDVCLALAVECKTPITVDAKAYALVSRHLNSHKRMTIEEAVHVFKLHGIPESTRVTKLCPYPESHMDEHPLKAIDPNLEPPAYIRDTLKKHGDTIHMIRERRHMCNAIVIDDGVYKWESDPIAFVREIRRMQAELNNKE